MGKYQENVQEVMRQAGRVILGKQREIREITQMQNIVCEAAYGFEGITVEKEERVRDLYFRTGGFIYGRLSWGRKLLFRYWKAFG